MDDDIDRLKLELDRRLQRRQQVHRKDNSVGAVYREVDDDGGGDRKQLLWSGLGFDSIPSFGNITMTSFSVSSPKEDNESTTSAAAAVEDMHELQIQVKGVTDDDNDELQHHLTQSKTILLSDISALKQQRTKLLQEIEIYNHHHYYQHEEEEKINKKELLIREEMEIQMQSLYTEKFEIEKELDDLKLWRKRHCTCSTNSKTGGGGAAVNEDIISRLKKEIQLLRGENASLRGENDELRSLSQCHVGSTANSIPPMATHAAVESSIREYKRSISYDPQRERFGSSTGSGNNSLEMIDGTEASAGGSGNSSRERLGTAGSDTVSALHEADTVSLLFGNSVGDGIIIKSRSETSSDDDDDDEEKEDKSVVVVVKPDHEEIRAHAEKLLYWANKSSSERTLFDKGDAVGSKTPFNTPNKQQQQKSSPIPTSIGLPPRSQSRVASRQLPPRCPPTASVTAGTSTLETTADGSSSSGNNDITSILSDKENGGATFNNHLHHDDEEVPGSFPTSSRSPQQQHRQQQQQSMGKKNVQVSEHDIYIDDCYNNNESQPPANKMCCECATSPFSGNDPQSEFYLPRLGLACDCVVNVKSIVKDRMAFSKNPTALSNILRPWQCNFLSTLDIHTADELLKAHRADANGMARSMKKWRSTSNQANNNIDVVNNKSKSKECYVALKIWSRTCKIVLRSIREQRAAAAAFNDSAYLGTVDGQEEQGDDNDNEENVIIEKPQFLDISFAADTHTITSISTLGHLSSVGGGGRAFEMMEI